MLKYKAIEIFTSEEARSRKVPVTDAVLQYVRDLKIAARCIVTRGIAGCYESGEMATQRLEVLSLNLPVRIYIVIPSAEVERVLDGLKSIVIEGIIALHDLNVVSHRTRNAFFPRQIIVKNVMTVNPKSVSGTSPLSQAARLLLSSIFTGIPVIDKQGHPIGVITQGDLIQRGGLPLRLGLLAESDQDHLEAVFKKLDDRTAAEVMTKPVITIGEDQPLSEAVNVMLERELKRLPVVNTSGRLSGMISRLDVFRTVMRESPDWKAFTAQKIEVESLRNVRDILRRDTHKVLPDAAIDEVILMIDRNDIQRVVVVDDDGRLLGLISDRDLLRYFKQDPDGIRGLLAKVKHPFTRTACSGDLQYCLAQTRAADVMNTILITVREDALIEEAIALMTEKALKRLPVVDDDGRFTGMISRDSLLRTGFSGTA